jgi:hypothetical protein
LLLLLLAAPTFAQDSETAARTAAGCGPDNIQFDVKVDKKQHPAPPPDSGKAIVFIMEDILAGPIMKVGLDGTWVGANKGKSYFYFSVEPGEHRLCSNWQSGVFKESAKRYGSATTFIAEAGKTYYYRILVDGEQGSRNVKLAKLENAEAQFLIAASPLSIFSSKK